ncbi:hypothetical protein Si102_02001 [Streptococcus infantarius subsp. infantarius]|nr:hypothetical protein [Streptococcus infantarius subsp. infantarius]MCO4536241.1 hypothetical protein [Streptococcus infantarius subsp. infantarius]MCO4537568.1 hypothetical protein [Streptococcus infantarius subsp. infantarius]
MNKQEAIDKIKNIGTLKINDTVLHQQFDMVDKNKVLDIISQIDEPQKPVIPKFVAEWIKSQKESFSDVSAIDMYDNLTLDNNGGYYHDVWLWVIDHHYDFIKAWHDGYTVEKEKRYTVEIPNTDRDSLTVLKKFDDGTVVISQMDVFPFDWKNQAEYQLTESEIKQDFEWAWQFAKEVEE